MRNRTYILSLLAVLAIALAFTMPSFKEQPYQPYWYSLTQYGCAPEWFRDAKLGIRMHWGPQTDSLLELFREAGAGYLLCTNQPSDMPKSRMRMARKQGFRLGMAIRPTGEDRKAIKRVWSGLRSYCPDLVGIEDTLLLAPPYEREALRALAHLYNKHYQQSRVKNEAVVLAGDVSGDRRDCLVWCATDSLPQAITERPWQATLGLDSLDATTLIHSLLDIVSLGGNLLLDVPLRPDGSLDARHRATLQQVADWMRVNGEGVIGTRPWCYSSEESDIGEIRFVQKGGDDVIYAHLAAWPDDGHVLIRTLSPYSDVLRGLVTRVELLGYDGRLEYRQDGVGVAFTLPDSVRPDSLSPTLRLETIKF